MSMTVFCKTNNFYNNVDYDIFLSEDSLNLMDKTMADKLM